MSFPYAQNFEEVTLWRSLKPFQHGVYLMWALSILSMIRFLKPSMCAYVGLPVEKDQENNLRLKNDK